MDMETATHRDGFPSDGHSVKETLRPNGRTHATTSTEAIMLNDAIRSNIADEHITGAIQVSYEDMANPRRIGTVVEHRAGEFRVMWDDEDGGETWSDLRQAGWNLALSAAWSR